MNAQRQRFAVFAIAASAALLWPGSAPASSPVSSVVSPGFTGCGGLVDLCEPHGDVQAGTFPAGPASSIPLAGLYGLDPADDLTNLSFGLDSFAGGEQVHVSVAPGAQGACTLLVPPDLCSESGSLCPAIPQVGADVYAVGRVGAPAANRLAIDGDGLVTCFAPPPPLVIPVSGMLEPQDDIDALEGCSFSTLQSAGVTPLLYFTLASGSPTLALLGAGPSDILATGPGGPPVVLWTQAALGLLPGDGVDALATDGAQAWLSLAPGSPSLALLSASAGDLLSVTPGGGSLGIAHAAGAWPNGFDLRPTDDVDALMVFADADADLVNDACDNCPEVANNGQEDANGDGFGDACPCIDGIDNDGDGWVDAADPGCKGSTDDAEDDPSLPCDDGLDNDGDGFVDAPLDPGCESVGFATENPKCQDGIDNDGDGRIDYDGGASRNGGVRLTAKDVGCGGFPHRVDEKDMCGLGAELAFVLPGLAALRRRRRRAR